ncbi:MAG TPA: N-formylglutamate deformylase [Burkholderiales bacterium]|nr:N-formylglutamate deformylase [Burkholderiales bacterium]
MEPFRFRAGTAPLLVSMPHVGTYVPPALAARMTDGALFLPDTDWHVDRLYDFLDALGASVLIATHSRYVVDLNRPPDNANLYPGQDTTGLVPVDTFARAPVYRDGALPDVGEIAARVERYWRPYHAQLARELDRLRAAHGYALLWDAHSIASEVPRFFPGRLPDLNLGTVGGASCAPAIEAAVAAVARVAPAYSSVLNGRFKGGYITRRYGQPDAGVHAIQLELAEITYMDEAPPFLFDEARAARLRPHLRAMLESILEAARAG